jgi:hypothetical protein
LEIETYDNEMEIIEGILSCTSCQGKYPIILSVPLLIEDLSSYFSIRAKLGGILLLQAKNEKIKSLLKKSLQNIKKVGDDTTDLEETWVRIYKDSSSSSFEKVIENAICRLSKCNLTLEHGCSIGKITEILAKHGGQVFGIDMSFFAILEAKKRSILNSDFFVANSLSSPFATSFDMAVALNLLEIVEPTSLVEIICAQTKRFVLLSDPYDYARGKNSVKIKLDEVSLRSKIAQSGFKFLQDTQNPSSISWKLRVNPRLELHYDVDLVIAEKEKI